MLCPAYIINTSFAGLISAAHQTLLRWAINRSAHPAKFSLPHRIAHPGWSADTGNESRCIRELKNVVERSVYRHGTSDYPLDDIIIDPFKRRPPEDAIAVSETTSLPTLPLDLREFQMQQEKELLQLSLQQGKYNQKRAAELLGLTYHQFRALLKKHQI